METLTTPQLISGPFAYQGQKTDIPDAPTGDAHASIQEGFPPVTMIPQENGGEAPYGQDFNGLGNLLSQFYFYTQNGGMYTFEQDVSDKIGGYPENALLWYFPPNGLAKWLRSTKPNNTDNFNTNPEVIGTSWVEENTSASIGNIGDIKESSREGEAPFGGVWCDGAEYEFSLYPQVGEMLVSGELRSKTYDEWQAELTNFGETEYFAYDAGSQKFKVPSMPYNGIDGIINNEKLNVYERPSRKYVVLFSGYQEVSLKDYTGQLDQYTATKQTEIEQTGTAQVAAVNEAGQVAKSWAIGTIEEQPEGSSKYWAEQAMAAVNVQPATETTAGIARLATADEAVSGSDDSTIITPSKLTTALESKGYLTMATFQVADALPANPVDGVFYFVRE